MHRDERATALALIRNLAANGLMPVREGGVITSENMAWVAEGWGDQQLRPYYEAASGFLGDIVGATGMRGEYDDDGLAEELEEVVQVVGLQHDRWGGVEHDAGHMPVEWMGFIKEHEHLIKWWALADPQFPVEMRRIAALAISAALAHRYARREARRREEA